MSKSDIDNLIYVLAEFSHIKRVLSKVRYRWRPSYADGSQSCEWEANGKYLSSLAKIAKKQLVIQKAEMEAYD